MHISKRYETYMQMSYYFTYTTRELTNKLPVNLLIYLSSIPRTTPQLSLHNTSKFPKYIHCIGLSKHKIWKEKKMKKKQAQELLTQDSNQQQDSQLTRAYEPASSQLMLE